ncbi:MAG: nucleotidyltransferase family protein [Gemmatimonadales bacterium]|nr:nucleotidyltransferase family protein [Gemmatimonadales bacterium]
MISDAVAHLLELLRIRGAPSTTDASAMWHAVSACPEYDTLLQREGATLWLYRRLHDCGVTLDSAAGATLRQSAHQQLMFGLRVDDETLAVTRILRGATIPFSPIKGPARRIAAGLYPYADARSTSDVDLLVPEARAIDAYDALVQHGYQPVGNPRQSRPEHFHLPALMGQRGVAVELHTSTAPWLSPTEAWRRQSNAPDTIRWEGQDFEISNATELLWHGMAHAFIDGADGFRTRTFLDGAVVMASGRSIDWTCITQRITAGEIRGAESGAAVPPRLLRRWIATAGMLAGVAAPAEFALDGEYPIARLFHWKSLVLRANVGRAARERLIEEAVRSEVGMLLTPSHPGDPAWVRLRRRVATASARGLYVGWRATLGSARGAQ